MIPGMYRSPVHMISSLEEITDKSSDLLTCTIIMILKVQYFLLISNREYKLWKEEIGTLN